MSERISDSDSFSFLASRRIYTVLIALLLISIGVIGAVLFNSPVIKSESLPVVESGDMVYVNYVGYFADNPGGWVFDTSIRNVAIDEGIAKSLYFVQREPKEYAPLNFTAGTATNLLIPFVKGVVGMTVTQTKRIQVPVEDAYPVVIQNVRTNYLNMEVPVIYRMTTTEFESTYKVAPVVGMTLEHDFWEWDTEVLDVNNDRIIMQNEPNIGMIVTAFGDPEDDPRDGWYQEVMSIDPAAYDGSGIIIVKNLITAQDIYQKKGADYDKVRFTLLDVNETAGTFSIVLNKEGYIGELVGRVLVFDITVTRVIKA